MAAAESESVGDFARVPWRTGRSVGRTIYACPPGSSYRDGEVLIGIMDTPDLAADAVRWHNIAVLPAGQGSTFDER